MSKIMNTKEEVRKRCEGDEDEPGMMISPRPNMVNPASLLRAGSLGKRSWVAEATEEEGVSEERKECEAQRRQTLIGASRPVATETIWKKRVLPFRRRWWNEGTERSK